ncbi:hypothetical protein CA54_43380 [Symmachiella macrocystis]|uniref:Uncharacterized protein n=1 Tax=Symmachiella macrocystis TaxID=2527985 RepID=A0A5C6BAU6_9PLAN|nr:hypothetical protein [Symmachiella macrocystis]TWU09098.1 hypothetical protein CA54_43380 [Symmachiella macrocystis]
MSSIGPSNPAAFNLASSFAGAQRTTSQQEESKAQQAAQKFQVEQTEAIDKDVVEADLDADRDADGRQSWEASPGGSHLEEQQDASDSKTAEKTTKHATDALGLRGGRLDVDA